MSEDIIVLDDFLPRHTYDTLAQLISAEPLAYGSRSNFKTDPHGHWSRDFVAAGPHNLADVADLLATDEPVAPVNAAWRFLRDTRLPDSVLVRCYLNGYTYGTDGYFHADSERPDEHTTILYTNDYWEADWAGETVFLGEDGDIIKAVLPRRNRAVLFPSGIQHAGRSVSRKCMVLRETLIFKARKRRGSDFEKLSAFLQRAGAVGRAHETGTLHDHLVRTFSTLEAKGLDRSVCFGGGLHAIYGTSTFKRGVLTREAKADAIGEFGERAEELAYLFSVLKRPGTLESPLALNAETAIVELLDGQTLELSRSTFDDLRQIECANLADQGTLARHRNLSGLWKGAEQP
jgi:SM-20-related protein